jgi:hypothetical protein
VIASEFALSVSSDWQIVTVYTPLNPMTASVDHASGTPSLQFDSWFQLPPAVLVQTSLPNRHRAEDRELRRIAADLDEPEIVEPVGDDEEAAADDE